MYSTFYLYPETSGPLNGEARELKYCELCGKPFARRPSPTVVYTLRAQRFWSVCGYSSEFPAELRRDRCEKLCPACVERPFTRDARVEELAASQARYREQLPTEREATHRRVYQMPDYRALNPTPNPGRPLKRIDEETKNWCNALREAFRAKGVLSKEDMADLVPGTFTIAQAWAKITAAGFLPRPVGFAPRRTDRGPRPKLYALPNVSAPSVFEKRRVAFNQTFIEQKFAEFRAVAQ